MEQDATCEGKGSEALPERLKATETAILSCSANECSGAQPDKEKYLSRSSKGVITGAN
jgi:hypothetical protein